jgi:hypothetical protein
MGYYDSVKDDVKNKNKSSSGDGKGNFDTLKQNASEETEQKKDDDTPIEVLDEGLDNSRRRRQKKSSSSSSNSGSNSSDGSGFPPADEENESKAVSADTSGLEQKLDKIIEQNAKMIEILESFGN